MSLPRKALLLAAAMLLLAQAPAVLGGATVPEASAEPNAARDYFTDVVLTDHEGRDYRLYSDLLHGRVVIISAMFTGCEGVCPVTMGNLLKIQDWLGPRLGNEVLLLSLTVDRAADSPARLKDYAEKLHAKPGWYFLTGSPTNLDLALRKLGLWVSDKESHTPVFLVGNEATGLWKKAQGMASAESLIRIVESVLEDRLESSHPEAAQGRR